MPMYTVFPIEPPVSPSQLAAYKKLRLTSLQTDPQVFIATYEREATLLDDDWRKRLDSPFKQTFVASVLDASHERGDASGGEENPEWIGTATVLGPSDIIMSSSILDPFREAEVTANWEMYGLYAVWVHPEHRSKGVAAQLIRACLEWARTNVDAKFSLENSEGFEKVVALHVYDDNTAARALYFRVGFADLEGVASKKGEKWMSVKV